MRRWVVAGVAALALLGVVCASSIHCDEHNQTATYVRDEWPNGKHYRVYSHGFGRDKHELKAICVD